MTILSPIMSFIVDKEVGFPIPSEKEKINKALKRYNFLLSKHPNRSDAPEIMFGIADMLVGRGEAKDLVQAMKFYDQILLRTIPEYLRARVLVGKAELMIGDPAEFDNAISLCERARKLLGNDVADFFAAKTYIVEAELRLARRAKGDWAKALDLINQVVKEKEAHWYFRGRALLAKAEITFYQSPNKLIQALKFVEQSQKELKLRPEDYFANKGKILIAEILTRRAKARDFYRAEKFLTEAIKMPIAYKDLIARAKLDLADVVTHPRATKLLKQVLQMEGLDPYLIEKASIIEKALNERETAKPAKAKLKKKPKLKKRKKSR
ncbi:MAG: hypothetical protein KKA31_02080 [Candidatus Margulisbacteria bacterium]|nr:hypothetical protein [Candidatus Margulisiibacteriota bacterium]